MRTAIFAILAVAISVVAVANSDKFECIGRNGVIQFRLGECTDRGAMAGGGEVPVPVGLRTKAELADGEIYILTGKILIVESARTKQAFFEVDLNEHPWLANMRRREDSRYPLEGALADWRPYNGRQVRIFARANGRVVRREGKPQYEIWLEGQQPDEDVHNLRR